MKKLFDLIRNQHSSIYRISLFVVAIIIGVYLMPRKISFKYEPIEGKPWPHESLISDMEFSILKPAEKISEEQQQIENQRTYFFTLDQTKEVAARIKLEDESLGYYLLMCPSQQLPLSVEVMHHYHIPYHISP